MASPVLFPMKCPLCKRKFDPAAPTAAKPFCSERCKGVDLGAWASEDFRVPDETPPDDLPFGDPKEQ